MSTVLDFFTRQGGTLCIPADQFAERFAAVKAFVFDWDGVFNDGARDGGGGGTFHEPDAMGTNLLRFTYWLSRQQLPIVAVLTGESNRHARRFVEREHYHQLYRNVVDKKQAFEHFIASHLLASHEAAFIFDDVHDLSVAAVCGVRILVQRKASPLLNRWIEDRGLADYVTFSTGGDYAVRESCELLAGVLGRYTEAIAERAGFTERYRQYLSERQAVVPQVFTASGVGLRSEPAEPPLDLITPTRR